jgi:hypothetical protein
MRPAAAIRGQAVKEIGFPLRLTGTETMSPVIEQSLRCPPEVV